MNATPQSPLWSTVAAFVAVLLALLVWNDYLRKPAPHRLWWALGVTMFALASSLGLRAALVRPTYAPGLPGLVRGGALFAPAFLGHGTAWLLPPKKGAQILTWVLVFYAGATLALAQAAPLELANLSPADALSGRTFPEIGAALAATPRFHTIFLNSYGALMLVAGALFSAWCLFGKPELANRMWGTLLIAGGGMAMGAVGTLNRFGFSGAQSLGEVLALLFIFSGFKLSGHRRTVQAPTLPRREQVYPVPGD